MTCITYALLNKIPHGVQLKSATIEGALKREDPATKIQWFETYFTNTASDLRHYVVNAMKAPIVISAT